MLYVHGLLKAMRGYLAIKMFLERQQDGRITGGIVELLLCQLLDAPPSTSSVTPSPTWY